MLRKLSLVSGLFVMAVMLTPQASSATAPAPLLPAATAANSSLVAKATYYRRYDDDRDYRYRNRTYDHRDHGYRHYRERDNYHRHHHGYRHRDRDDRYYSYYRRWW